MAADTVPAASRPGLAGTLRRIVPAPWPRGNAVALRAASWLPALAATALAAAIRLSSFAGVPANPYYDAAVRSMGRSWHNFFFGAYEPGGAVSIDKPPVDLWLQVASVKLLGFGSWQLRLPVVLAGIAAVPLLYATLRPLGGRVAATVGALALAVLPIAVLTDRSDTMDSVMVAFDVAAAWLVVRSARRGGVGWLLAAGAMLGLAFNVKLFEALVALPALATLYWMASREPRLHRLGALTAAAGTLVVVSLAWLSLASALPAHSRPFPIGSTSGSVWQSTFVFDGTARVSSTLNASLRDPPGPTRLLRAGGRGYGTLVGSELVAAVALGALAIAGGLALALRGGGLRERERMRRAGATGFALWLATAVVLLSSMRQLHPRYVELIAPAVAGVLGLAAGGLADASWRRASQRPGSGARIAVVAVGAVLMAALLWAPFGASMDVAGSRISDSGRPGSLPPRVVRRLSAYLARHSGKTRYEAAVGTAIPAAPLIVHDGRPLLILSTVRGQRIVAGRTLAAAVRRGELRYALLTRKSCSRRSSSPLCVGAFRWAIRHGTDVSHRAGIPTTRKLVLLRLHRGTVSAASRDAGRRRR